MLVRLWLAIINQLASGISPNIVGLGWVGVVGGWLRWTIGSDNKPDKFIVEKVGVS